MAYTFRPRNTGEYLEDLPEIQKRRRRAAQLRKLQARGEEAAAKDVPLGEVTKGSKGSLYDIQGRYIPNTYGQTMKAIGAISGLYHGRQADKAEDAYNESANPYLSDITQQVGQGYDTSPSAAPPDASQALASTLGLPPGQDTAPQAGQEVLLTEEDKATMNPEQLQQISTTLTSLNRTGQTEAAQEFLEKARRMAAEKNASGAPAPNEQGAMGGPQAGQMQDMGGGQPPQGGMGSDPFAAASPGSLSAGSSGPAAGLNTFSDPTGAITPQKRMQMERTLASMRAKGASDQEIEDYMVRSFAEAEAEATGTHSMVPGSLSRGAVTESPMEESEAGPVEQELSQSLGLAPKARAKKRDPNMPTDATLRLYFGLAQGKEPDLKDLGIGGDRRLFSTIEDKDGNIIQQYSDGSIRETGIKARAKGVQYKYDEYEKAWYKFDPTYGPEKVGAAEVPNNIRHTTTDGRLMTPDEVTAATTGGAVPVAGGPARGPGARLSPGEKKAEEAPIEVDVANQKEANKMALERQNAARNALSKMDLTSNPGADAATNLLKHPGLKRITAGTWGSYADAIGRKDEKGGYPFFGIGALARPALAQKDPEAADALALIDQVRSSAFATGFQALVGQGAGSISDAEGQGIARALANMETARTTSALEQALKDYIKLKSTIEARWRREAAGEGAAPAQGGGKYSNMSDDDLLKSLIPGG